MLLTPLQASTQVQIDSGIPAASVLASAVWLPAGNLTLVRVLRQMDRPVSRARLDELADSLAAFAIRTEPESRREVAAISIAVNSLGWAAMTGDTGVPYAGAASRLLRIAEQGTGTAPSGAISAISRLPDRQEALRMLTYCAALDRPVAFAAIGHLDQSMGPEGRAALKALYERGAIRNRLAQDVADDVARRERWTAQSWRP